MLVLVVILLYAFRDMSHNKINMMPNVSNLMELREL